MLPPCSKFFLVPSCHQAGDSSRLGFCFFLLAIKNSYNFSKIHYLSFSGTVHMLFPLSRKFQISLPAKHILISEDALILPGKPRYSSLCSLCICIYYLSSTFQSFCLCKASILCTVNILKVGTVSLHLQWQMQSRHSKIICWLCSICKIIVFSTCPSSVIIICIRLLGLFKRNQLEFLTCLTTLSSTPVTLIFLFYQFIYNFTILSFTS